MGSFEAWDHVVRGALIRAGEADLNDGCDRVMEDLDVTADALGLVLIEARAALKLHNPFDKENAFTVRELLGLATEGSALAEAIKDWRAGERDPLSSDGVGRAIKAALGTIVGGLKFVRAPGKKTGGAAKWCIRATSGL